MQAKIPLFLLSFVLLTGCVSIPKETIVLSKTMGKDLVSLEDAHQNLVALYYNSIEKDINSFIDEVYSPFVIHYVLKKEMEAMENGEKSLYSSIEAAGLIGGKEETEVAVRDMEDFLNAANKQIQKKRMDLLAPVIAQRKEITNSISSSYSNIIYANSTVTGYLESIREVKDAQDDALAGIGLQGVNEDINKQLNQVANLVSKAVEKGKEIDVKSDHAMLELEKIIQRINNATTK